MSENKKVDSVNNMNIPNNSEAPKEVTDALANFIQAKAKQQSSKELTMGYVLSKLEEISLGQTFVKDAISELGKMKSGGPGDVGLQEQAKAIADVVKARETTNQRLIALYEKMYDDLKPEKVNNERIALIGTLIESLGEGLTPIQSKEALTEILGTALQDLSKTNQ